MATRRPRRPRPAPAAKLDGGGIPPNTKDIPLLADYVELQALLSDDQDYSHSDLVEDLKRAADLGSASGDTGADGAEDDETGADVADPHDHPAAQHDRVDELATDVFQHLRFRASTLGEAYPFTIDSTSDTLATDAAASSDVQAFYAFLLLASALSRVDGSSRQLLTKHFELISAELLAAHLGWRGEVAVFGTTSGAAQSRFSGSLWKKVGQLAALLGEGIVTKESEFSPHDVGDNGLDIVGHLGFGDDATGRLVLFGQCACTDDWDTKQHTVGQDTWGAVLRLSQPIVPLVFIPFFFRTSTGAWFSTRRIHRTVVVDRLRLLRISGVAKLGLPTVLQSRLAALVPRLKAAG